MIIIKSPFNLAMICIGIALGGCDPGLLLDPLPATPATSPAVPLGEPTDDPRGSGIPKPPEKMLPSNKAGRIPPVTTTPTIAAPRDGR